MVVEYDFNFSVVVFAVNPSDGGVSSDGFLILGVVGRGAVCFSCKF